MTRYALRWYGRCDSVRRYISISSARQVRDNEPSKLKQKYPDARPMGFPFDRPAHEHVQYLNDFLLDNMVAQEVVIKFLNKTVTSVDQGTDGAGKDKPI